MNKIWKGALSPVFTKHHGGTLEEHIELKHASDWPGAIGLVGDQEEDQSGKGWEFDGTILTAYFRVIPDATVYAAEWELESDEAEDLDDEAVKELIANQLKLPIDKRLWKEPEIELVDTEFE